MKSISVFITVCLFSSLAVAQVNIYNDVQTLNVLLKKNLNANPSIEFDTKRKVAYYSNDWNRLEIPLVNVRMLKYNDSTISFKSIDGNKWVASYTKQRRFLRNSSDYTITVKRTDSTSSLYQMIALFSGIQRTVTAGNAVYIDPETLNKEKMKITSANYREQLAWFEKEAIKQDPEIKEIKIGKLGLDGDGELYLSIKDNNDYITLINVSKFTSHLTNSYISIDCNDDKVCAAVIKKGTTKIDYSLSSGFTHIKHIGNLEEREKFYNTFVALIDYARLYAR